MADSQEDININIKQSDGSRLSVSVSLDDTISKLKEEIAAKTEVPVDLQRLVYSGKVLKDEEDVGAYNLKNGFTVQLVHRNPSSSAQVSLAQKSASTTSQNTTSVSQQPPPSSATGAMRGMISHAMINHPAFYETISRFMMDRERIRSLALTNPALQSLGLTPEKIEQVLDLYSDPTAREMLIETNYGTKVGPGHPPALDKAPSSDGHTRPAGEFPSDFLAMLRNYDKDVDNGVTDLSKHLESMRQYIDLLPKIHQERKQLAANLLPPEVRFQVQLIELKNMRFHDTQKNISALLATGGDLQAAVEYLCANPQ